MELHVVVNTVGGFAREDADTASVLGAYTDPVLAHQLKTLWGSSATVCKVEVNAIPPGLRSLAKEMRMELKEPQAVAE